MLYEPTAAECEAHARVFQQHGYYAKAASLWRDAAELTNVTSLRELYRKNAKSCDDRAKGEAA